MKAQDKIRKQERRSKKTRERIRKLGVPRLCVIRSPRHIYAQVIEIGEVGDKVLAQASSLDNIVDTSKTSGKIEVAKIVGKLVAERAIEVGIKKLAFDRSGFKYHGRIKALAESARESGLEI